MISFLSFNQLEFNLYKGRFLRHVRVEDPIFYLSPAHVSLSVHQFGRVINIQGSIPAYPSPAIYP